MNTDYYITNNKSQLDIDTIHHFLSHSYWAKNIPKKIVQTAIDNSLCFGVYSSSHQQVGFARVITDKATFAYLSDVFILTEHRKKGLSKRLVNKIKAHPELQKIRRFMLATADAHDLYLQYGFAPVKHPELFMEIWQPTIYQTS